MIECPWHYGVGCAFMKPSSFHGLLVLDKPSGLTSRDVVNCALRWFPRGTKIGHTGTLDPLATGVLVVCVGTTTRLAEYVQRMDKTYRAGLLLGARSDTDDADGALEAVPVERPPDRSTVAECLQEFVGEIEQVPPAYSAAKVTGRRAYDLARQGKDVSLERRKIRIYRIDLVDYAYPRLDLQVRCGKGTYIRSLARDLGERLGCGALVQTLRRTRVGPFETANALRMNADAVTAQAALLPMSAAVADLPQVTLAGHDVRRLRQGQAIPYPEDAPRPEAGEVAVFDLDLNLVAVTVVDRGKGLLRPVKVLS
jgi:tRNA pseudouridine55 synthase